MSQPASLLSIPSSSASARPCFYAFHQERVSTEPRRLPPTSPTVFARLSPASNRVGRHWCPWLITKNPASNMRSRPYPGDARPNCLPAIRRGRRATCCLSASATERSPSTPPYCPNSSETVASHFLTEWRRPFRAATNRASSGQGSLGLLNRVDPHHSDRSPRWIYPNLIGSGTPCHEIVPSSAWKNHARRSCGVGPLANDPARSI